jgi:CDP-diacylglycerol--glycerol-3-phosphate 3-phosphatidyltransferase/cardiolipin synthase
MDAGPPESRAERSLLIRSLPNLLSSIRLALGIAFPLFPAGARGMILLTAAATEFLDGQVARLLRVTSTAGRLLDPIADKVFIVAVLATLVAEGTLAPRQLALIAARDIVVTIGALSVFATHRRAALKRMPPSLLGKCATAAQFLFIAVTVVGQEVSVWLLLVTSALSVAAGIDYVVRFR